MARKNPCIVCATTHFKKTPNGFYVCRNGHQLANYRQEESEFTGGHFSQRKKAKVARKTLVEEKKNLAYVGERGRFHHFVCFQYILKTQVLAFMEIYHLPKDYEKVVQDLWNLYVSSTDLTYTESKSSFMKTESTNKSDGDPERDQGDELDQELFRGSYYQPDDSDTEPDQVAVYPDELIHDSKVRHEPVISGNIHSGKRKRDRSLTNDEAIVYDDQGWAMGDGEKSEPSDDEWDTESKDQGSKASDTVSGKFARKVKERKKRRWHDPTWSLKLHSTLILCYLGCIWYKWPVTVADVIRQANSRQIPYYTAYTILPEKLRMHMSMNLLCSLRGHLLPRPQLFHAYVADFVNFYKRRHGLVFPKLNAPMFVYRYLRDLSLPAEIAVCTLDLLHTLTNLCTDVFSPPSSSSSSKSSKRAVSIPKDLLRVGANYRRPPCAILLAMMFVVVKICYGLDGRRRIERKDADTAETSLLGESLPELETWFEQFHENCRKQELGEHIPISFLDLPDFAEQNPKEYVQFCNRLYQDRDSLVKSPDPVIDAFETIIHSLPKSASASRSANKSSIPRSPRHQRPTNKPPNLEPTLFAPGEAYMYHPEPDARAKYPRMYDQVLGYCACLVGLEKDAMQSLVTHVEKWIMELSGKSSMGAEYKHLQRHRTAADRMCKLKK